MRKLNNIFILIAILIPISIMTGQKLPSPLFYILIAISLALLTQVSRKKICLYSREYKSLLLGMSISLIVVLFSSALHQKLVGLDLEVSIRFFIGTWVLILGFLTLESYQLQKIIIGYVITALLSSVYILFLVASGESRPQTIAVYNAVGYGSLTALFMVIALFSVKINFTKYTKAELVIKLLIALLSFVAVILTQTRTAWMAMPVFIIVGAILFFDGKQIVIPDKNTELKKSYPKFIGIIIILFVVIGTVFISNHTMRYRAVQAYNQAVNCVGNKDTVDNSICIRFQLWRASIDMLSERPVIGNGSKRYFNDYLQNESYPKGIVSEFVASGWGEPHNDMFLYLASFGFPGGVALLVIYLVPGFIFARRLLKSNSNNVKTAAAMGLCVCLGFMIFGFTETMFRHMRTVSFYTMSVAFFMALSHKVRD